MTLLTEVPSPYNLVVGKTLNPRFTPSPFHVCVCGGGGGGVKYKFSYLCFRSSQSFTILGKISVDRDNPQQYQLGRHPLTLAFTAAGVHFDRINGGESRDSLHLYSDRTGKYIRHYFVNTQYNFIR